MDSVSRFSQRVENYVKYRPTYPSVLLDHLIETCKLATDSHIADIGSGTGIFTRLLLDRGFHVSAVEPGDDMRAAAESALGENDRFTSIPNRAEATGLADHTIDLVTVAQAFHWLNIDSFRAECKRILKPQGWVGIIWNNRQTSGDPFLEGYENILRNLPGDYSRVNHADIPKSEIARFFGGDHFQYITFPNEQLFDWNGLLGRTLSSSYIPTPGDPGHESFVNDLRALYDQYAVGGQVRFVYESELYLGQLRD